MRIKRENLLSLARNTVAEKVRYNKSIVSVYLTGSLLGEDFLMGGTADIDLVFIHDDNIVTSREILPFSDEIHIDIANLSQRLFQQPRSLRNDPWISPFFCLNPLLLHDTQHWFEFTQASLCSQANRPEYVIQRARSQYDEARKAWMGLHSNVAWNAEKLLIYLKSIEKAGNAIALLSGAPLTERKFLMQFAQRCNAIHRPGLAEGLLDLIVAPGEGISSATLTEWLPAWTHALNSVAQLKEAPLRLTPCRLPYYLRAGEALSSDYPTAALWIMLRTWTLAICHLGDDAQALAMWQQACQSTWLDV
ncbi:MAG: hypothetical protein LWX83_19255, partial [Anaerolineae bacterium]|nr:hypothetical protein [Anaerolineae bacterium]